MVIGTYILAYTTAGYTSLGLMLWLTLAGDIVNSAQNSQEMPTEICCCEDHNWAISAVTGINSYLSDVRKPEKGTWAYTGVYNGRIHVSGTDAMAKIG